MSLAFLDLETTGLAPERHCIWEIGLITDSGEYQWVLELTNEELKAADPMALAVGQYYRRSQVARVEYEKHFHHRFTPGIMPNDPEIRSAWKSTTLVRHDKRHALADFIVKEIDTSHIVGAVPSFDERRLRDFCQQHDRVLACHYHLVDVEALAAGKLGKQPPWSSKELYRDLGVNPKFFKEHTALGDARMAKAVYEKVFELPATWPTALIPIDKEAVPA